jgi:EpsI family protein
MAERRERTRTLVLAGAIIVAAFLASLGLVWTGLDDDSPHAWVGRLPGLGMAAVAMAIGVLMIRRPSARTPYWGLVGALTLGALAIGAYSYQPAEPQKGMRAKVIPLRIGAWQGTEGEVAEENIEVLGTEDMIMRSYIRGTDRVGLAVIFSMSKRKVAHPPEQCYAADGFEINYIDYEPIPIRDDYTINGRRLTIIRGPNRQVVLYWYRAGDYNTGNFALSQLYVILSNLMMQRTTHVALIRLSTHVDQVDDATVSEAAALLKEFARELFPEIEAALK